jgi:hypothetical protein
MKNKNKWTYTPELHKKNTFTFRDLVDLVNGNIAYAKSIQNRLEWQHPATLIDEDKRNGEALFINEQFYFVGQKVKIHQAVDDCCREDLIGLVGTIQSFVTDKKNGFYGMMSVRFELGDVNSYWKLGDVNSYWPEEVIFADSLTFTGKLWDVLYSESLTSHSKVDKIEEMLINN